MNDIANNIYLCHQENHGESKQRHIHAQSKPGATGTQIHSSC